MQYRVFGKDGFEVSALGFGAMRFPAGKDSRKMDEPGAVDLLRYGIDRGINYVDTAYIYHDGRSEVVVGKALKNGYRDRVRVADKSPGHLVQSAADFRNILEQQLRRLDMEHIDYYMFHGINRHYLQTILEEDLLTEMMRAQASGKIGHIGFSFHDNTAAFRQIIDATDLWEFCMIQYNYMDIHRQAGTEGFDYAARKGLPIIVMEPLLGGRLANPPADVLDLMSAFSVQRTPAEWALSWLWNHPAVVTILSGMATSEQIDENCRIASEARPGHLTGDEIRFMEQIRHTFSRRAVIPCTRCDYCKPCPEGIDIGWMLELYNDSVMFDNLNAPRFAYNHFVSADKNASACSACGECESRCPQEIEVSAWMPRVHDTLDNP